MPRRRLAIFAVATLALLVPSPTGALAQDDGVTVDPGSPSAKEYAIPLESARKRASPKPSTSSAAADQQQSATPLFGAGAGSPPPSAQAPAKGTAKGGKRPSKAAKDPARVTPTTPEERTALAAAASNPGSPAAGSPLGVVLGVGGALLLIGALAGFVVKRRVTGPA